MINDRRQLADVFQQTINIVQKGHYTSENGEEVTLLDNEPMLKGSRFYTKPLDASNVPTLSEKNAKEKESAKAKGNNPANAKGNNPANAKGNNPANAKGNESVKAEVCKTQIIVRNDDSIHCGHSLQLEGYNPVVLNLASRRNPGGGVKNGSRAQEESLFRSTNLFLSMYRYAEYAEDYGLEKSRFQYPMPVRFGGIYVPKATVFRAGAKDDFALLDTPYYMSFVAVAAINHPELDADGNICQEDANLTKNKMRTMLRIGLLNGHDSIVLGAFGCGAFHNPPKHIARLFHEVIDEKEFKDKYKLIAFAILEDHNSPRGGNLQPFIEEFNS